MFFFYGSNNQRYFSYQVSNWEFIITVGNYLKLIKQFMWLNNHFRIPKFQFQKNILLSFDLSKVHIFWVHKNLDLKFKYSEKAKKFEKNLPLKIWHYSVTSNFKWKIFSNFVAFSEYPNFNLQQTFVKPSQVNSNKDI